MKVVIAKANGDGGFMDPSTGLYISSQTENVVPLTTWVENMANHERVTIVEELGDDYERYAQVLLANGGDQTKALEAYREGKDGTEGAEEKTTVVASPADLETLEATTTVAPTGEPRRARKTAQ